ncbi:MAG: hypothetical protein ACRD12_08985, partial [Acidimicrobiales bacterium]
MGSRGRFTVGAVQERFPWLMRPVEIVDGLATPARWRHRITPGSEAGRNAVRVDSTWLTEILARLLSPLPPVREALVSRSPLLARVDWETRKLVWSLVWNVVVSYGLRPKKPPVPKDERRINLISARESYADFHCDNLVVPDDVP